MEKDRFEVITGLPCSNCEEVRKSGGKDKQIYGKGSEKRRVGICLRKYL